MIFVPIALLMLPPMLGLLVPVVRRVDLRARVDTMMTLDLTLLPIGRIVPQLRLLLGRLRSE
jgi:hypothetical protein